MAKYISGRVKRRDQSQLSSDRYKYLSLDQTEPNLGDTPNDVGTPGLPSGQQFIVVGFRDRPGERFWVPKEGGIIPGSISVFDEGTLVGALSSITQLDFIGNSVTASSDTLVESTLTLKNSETFSFSENLLVTQSGNTASGIVKFPTTNSGIVTLTNVSGTFNNTGELLQSNVSIGRTPTGSGTVVTTSTVAADITIAPPGNNNSVLFKNNNDFDTDSRFTFTDGLFTAGDRIAVGTGGTVITTLNSGFVGIGTTNPKRELHLIGNFRLNGTIYDTNNNSGSQGQLLLKGTSGLVWSNQSAISAGAGGDVGQIQFHNSAGVLGGSDNIYYDPQNERIGIGTDSPSQLLDVVGISTFDGEVFIKTLTVEANAGFNFNVDITNNLDVDGNTELDALNVDGHTELDTLNVSVATTTSKLNVTGHSNFNTLEVSGISTFNGLLDINAGFEANTLRLEDLTDNRVVIVGVNGEVEDDPNFTFDGNLLNVGAGLSVSGTTTLNDLNVTGVATVSNLDFSGGLSLSSLVVSGISTLGNLVADGNTLKTATGNLIIDSATTTTAVNDTIFQNNSTQSTNTSSGALVTIGGAGIAKNLNVGGNVSIAGTTVGVAVTLASNGGITTTGGDLFVGNDLNIKGDLVFDELEARRGVFTEYLQTLGFKATGVSTFTNDIFAESTLTVGPSLGDATYPTDQGTLAVYSSGGKNALIIQTLDNTNSRGIAFRNSGDAYIGYISMENRGSNLGDMVFGVDDGTESNVNNVEERLRITKEGRVGIGTTDVQADLHIESATPGIRLSDTNNSGAYAFFDANAANAIIHADKDNQVSNSRVAFAVDNDEKVRITSEGHVGIGTDNPDSIVKADNSTILHVGIITARKIFGDADITGTVNNTKNVEITDDTSNSGTHYIHFGSETFGNDGVEVDSNGLVYKDGKVGIGTNNSNYLLDVYKSTGTNQDVFAVRGQTSAFLVQCSDLSAANPTWNLRSFAAEDITLKPGNSESVRFKSNGNVGINETTPSNRLHVKETNSNTIVGKLESSGAYSYLSLEDGSTTTGHVRVGAHGNDLVLRAGNDNHFRITSAGKVGIGTGNPLQKLHIVDDTSANIYLETKNPSTGSTAGIYFRTSDSSTQDAFFKTAIVLEDDGTTFARGKLHILQENTDDDSNATLSDSVVTIDHGGKVGIHSTSPETGLDILSDDGIFVRTVSNGPTNGARIQFSDRGSGDQRGHIIYKHPDNSISPGSNDGFLIGGNQSLTVVRVEGRAIIDEKVGIGTDSPAYSLDLGKTASTIRLVSENNGTAIRMGAGGGSNDVTLIRVDGQSNNHNGESDSAQFGFSVKYMGSRDQNDNSLSIFSDNQQAGTQIEAVTVLQDGKVGIGSVIPAGKLDVDGNIFPSITDTHDIGSATKRWNNIFAKDIDVEGDINLTGDITINDLFVSGISTFVGEVEFRTHASFGDNDKVKFGDGDDLQIYHDGANSYVSDQGTGDLRLSGNVVKLNNQANTATMIKATEGGSVELNHNNSKKFETTGIGVSVTGSIEGYDDLRSPFDSTARTIIVTVAAKTSNHRYSGTGSSNGYLLDGMESPFLTLTPGRTYKFDQSDSSNSGHPLRFYLESDKTTQYSTGVTNSGTPGNSGAYVQIVVSDETPIVLHYQCTAHGYMGNALQSNSNVVNTNYQATIRNNLSITPPSGVDGLVIDGTSPDNDSNPHIKLKGNGPQVIDFRDGSDGNGIKIAYRTTPNQWRLEKSESDGYIYFLADRDDGRLELYHNNSKKFETTSTGINVDAGATLGGTAGTLKTSQYFKLMFPIHQDSKLLKKEMLMGVTGQVHILEFKKELIILIRHIFSSMVMVILMGWNLEMPLMMNYLQSLLEMVQ